MYLRGQVGFTTSDSDPLRSGAEDIPPKKTANFRPYGTVKHALSITSQQQRGHSPQGWTRSETPLIDQGESERVHLSDIGKRCMIGTHASLPLAHLHLHLSLDRNWPSLDPRGYRPERLVDRPNEAPGSFAVCRLILVSLFTQSE